MKHKLTPKILDQIEKIAAALPPEPVRNHDGSPKFRKMAQRMQGKDIPPSTKMPEGHIINPNAFYVIRWTEPVNVNHNVKLRLAYREHGEQGVVDYVERMNGKTDERNKSIKN